MNCKIAIALLAILQTLSANAFDLNILEHLVPSSSNVENSLCRKHSELYLRELRNGSLWAWKMFDSSSKIPSGILDGASTDFGNFDECIAVRAPENGDSFSGKYCLPTFEIAAKTQSVKNTETWAYIETFSGQSKRIPRNVVRWAICIPSTCTEQDLHNHLEYVVRKNKLINKNIEISFKNLQNTCHTKNEYEYTFGDYAFLCTAGTIVFIVLVSTVYTLFSYSATPTTKFQAILQSFSICTNYNKLVSTTTVDPNNLECIHGMRVLSTFNTVIVHILVIILQAPTMNTNEIEEWPKSFSARTVLNFHSVIDIYFVLTSFLTTLMILEDLHRKKEFSYIRFYVHRLVRCMPLHGLMIFFYSTIFIKLGNGPFWKEFIAVERDNCRENWWASVLFVNNYINADKICVIQSWFFSASMQMFFITPGIVILLYKKPKIGISFITGLIFFLTGFNLWRSYQLNLGPIILFTKNVLVELESPTFTHGYLPTHTRLSPYLIAILAAYWRFKIKVENKKISPLVVKIGWITAESCLIFVLYWGGLLYMREPYNQLESSLFTVFYHIMVGYAMSWTIVATSTKNGYYISWLLERKGYEFYSKITYSVNMCNFSILYYITASSRLPMHMSKQFLVWYLVSTVVMTYAVGLVLYLFFEAPFINLDRLLSYKAKPHPNQEESSQFDKNK